MKKVVFSLLWCAMFVMLGMATCQERKPEQPLPPMPEVKAMHHFGSQTIVENRSCSSAAVGRHTLLTAEHCFVNVYYAEVDGKPYKVMNVERDGKDHILVAVDTVFWDTIPVDQREPRAGEHARLWGWPGESQLPILRDGFYIGHHPNDDRARVWFMDVNPGDSGAALVSEEGKVIGTCTYKYVPNVMGSYPMAFTPEQLKKIY